MFWRRATRSGGLWRLLAGIATSISLYILVGAKVLPVSWITFSSRASVMAVNMWRAWWAWVATVIVIVAVSWWTTPPRPEELKGLVYGLTQIPRPQTVRWWQRPEAWALVSLAFFLALNIYFW
jgi:SSS family solute:Na+ symporter